MKKGLFFIISLLCITISFVSCKNNKAPQAAEEIKGPVYTFTQEDSTSVMGLVNSFIEKMQHQQLNEAMSMLYYLDGDSIRELTKQQYARQANSLANIRGIRYELEFIKLETNIYNDAKINVILFENKEGEKHANTIAFHLNPVCQPHGDRS